MAKKSSILLNLLNFGPKKINNIISTFEDPDQIFKVKASDLDLIPTLSNNDIEKILVQRDSQDLDRELKLIEREKIDCLDIFD